MPGAYRIGRLNGRFVVSWWIDGSRRRHRLDARTAKDAEREALDVIRREAAAPVGAIVKDLWDAYREEKDGRRVAVAMKHEWKAIGPHFGHLRPDQVTVATSRSYVASRRRTIVRGKTTGVHDGTIWTELGHLRTVLVWALGDEAPKIERPAKPAPKDRYLTRAEIEKLLDAPAALHVKTAIHLMLATGARIGAILDLTWERVDFERGQIDYRSDAVGPRKGRAVVPMNSGLRAALTVAALTDQVIEWAGSPAPTSRPGSTSPSRRPASSACPRTSCGTRQRFIWSRPACRCQRWHRCSAIRTRQSLSGCMGDFPRRTSGARPTSWISRQCAPRALRFNEPERRPHQHR